MASKELTGIVDQINKYITTRGIDENIIEGSVEACKMAFLKDNDIVYGKALSDVVKTYIDKQIAIDTNGKDFKVLEEWAQANKEKIPLIEFYYDLLLLEAPYYVDSFKLYIEKDRPRKERFYEPRRRTLIRVSNAFQKLEEDELDVLFLHAPPRGGKSGESTMDMVWHCARHMEQSNLYVTYKEGLGGAFLDGVKEIMTDPTYKFREVFPDAEIVYTDAKNNKLDLGRKKKYRTLSGKGLESGLNGEYDATGLLMIDDPLEGVQDVLSPEVLKRKQTIFDNNVLSRKKEKCKLFLIGTLWATNCILSNYLNYLETVASDVRHEVIKIPALDPETDESNFVYDYGVGFSTEYYRQVRAKHEMNDDMVGWMCQYQQSPIEREGAVFNPEHMNYYTELPDEKPLKVIAHGDTALGGEDYTSFPVLYVYEDGSMYCVDVVFDNGEKHVTQPQIVAMIKKHNIRHNHFEANQGGEGYADDIKRMVSEDASIPDRDLIVKNIRTDWAPSTKSKEQRIWDNAQDIRQIYFKVPQIRDAPYRKFMQNLFSFTMKKSKHKHDDAADSLAGVMDFCRSGSGVSVAVTIKSPF